MFLQKQKIIIGKVYSEKLWIPNNQRKTISLKEMKTDIRLSEGKFTFIKKGQSNYVLESYSQKYDSVHYNDGRDYLTGEADINLRDENGNNKKIVDVKIYLEKDNKKIYMYNGKISENRYYFDIIMNSLEGIYTINVEVKDEDRKNIYTKN